MNGAVAQPGEFVGPTVFSSRNPSFLVDSPDVIHYRPSTPQFGDRFLSDEERKKLQNSNVQPIVTKRNSYASSGHFTTQSSNSSLISGKRSSHRFHEMSPTGHESTHPADFQNFNDSTKPSTRTRTNDNHFDMNGTGYTGTGELSVDIDSNGHRPSVELTDTLHQQSLSPGNNSSRPPSFSFADDELNGLNDEEERIKREMQEAEANLRRVQQLKEQKKAFGRDSQGQHEHSSVSDSSLSSRQSVARAQAADTYDGYSASNPPPISPRRSTSKLESPEPRAYPADFLEELQNTLRRNASKTSPIISEYGEEEFREKVLRRQESVNETSREYLAKERELLQREHSGQSAASQESNNAGAISDISTQSNDNLKGKMTFDDHKRKAEDELAQLRLEMSAEKFFHETPVYGGKSGLPLPEWKRKQLAQKRADEAYNRAAARINEQLEEARKQFN
jgi:hypothetical protein